MNKQNQKDKFVELRIAVETFETIAKNLKVSKQTLITWSKEANVQDTIDASDLMNYQSKLKLYKLNREAKIEHFLELHTKIREEIKKRDLSKVKTESLFKILIEIENRISGLLPQREFGGELNDLASVFSPSFLLNPQD